MKFSSLVTTALVSAVHAAPAPAPGSSFPLKDKLLPFSRMVAFGDNLSDNGNGSYAHCVQSKIGSDCQNSIYGFRTWTNGPVAVSFLTDLLNVPLDLNFAFGWALGGSKMAATFSQNYTYTLYTQTGQQQVQNYTSNPAFLNGIKNALHFLWIGNNDINLLHFASSRSNNSQFAGQMANQMMMLVDPLIKAGAPYIFVPSLYAKELGPNWRFYASNATERNNMGLAIQQANAAIKAALLKKYPKKIIWYDSYTKMHQIWNNAASYNINFLGDNFCDGYSQEDWNICVNQHRGSEFYWMQYTDMTSHVHNILAQDMAATIKAYFA